MAGKIQKQDSRLSGNEWEFVAKSYLALAYIGVQEIKSRKYFDEDGMHILKRSQWQVYDAQLLLIPILWNLKHAIELVLKAQGVIFQSDYLETHNAESLVNRLKESLDIQGRDDKFHELAEIANKYLQLKFFNKKLLEASRVMDVQNDIFRYPEGSKAVFHLDLNVFQKITEEDIAELEADIELLHRRLSIPAEYKHLKKFWEPWAHRFEV